jgi:TonB family protein
MFARIHAVPVLVGVLTAVLIGFAVQTPATAATFGGLIPVAPVNAIEAQRSSSCPLPDSNARITDPYPTQWLTLLAAQTDHATAQVMIDLDSVGNLMQAQIVRSSGNTLLDQKALVAARGSKYAPEVRNCNSFKRSYYLDITFGTPTVAVPFASDGSGHHTIR